MRSTFLDTRFVDIFGIVEEGRIVKSEEEIRVMRHAAKATEAGMHAGLKAAAPGVYENEIASEICAAMFKAGGEYPAVLPYVTSGPRTLVGHATWEGRRVEKDEVVFLEVGGCFRRYHTAMMRTVFTGDPPASVLKAAEIVQEARGALLDNIRPGMTAGEVDQLNHNIINDNKLGGYLITRAGYSIGIAFPPSWDEGYILSLKSGEKTPLQEGMTLHLLPWIYGVDDQYLVGMSETIMVTDEGCQSFFSGPPAELVTRG
jgi:Xaa-Pro dipeptidase